MAIPASTPWDLGLTAENLWAHLAPRHGLVAVLDEDGLTDAFVTEAILLAEGLEGLTVCAPAGASPELPPVLLEAQADSTDPAAGPAGQVACVYLQLPHGAYRLPEPGAALTNVALTFADAGGSPFMAAVVVTVPLELLPENIAGPIMDMAEFREEDPDINGEPLTAADLAATAPSRLLDGPGSRVGAWPGIDLGGGVSPMLGSLPWGADPPPLPPPACARCRRATRPG